MRLGGSGLGSEGLGNVVVDGERREAHNCHGCGDRLMVPTKVFDDRGFIARFYDNQQVNGIYLDRGRIYCGKGCVDKR